MKSSLEVEEEGRLEEECGDYLPDWLRALAEKKDQVGLLDDLRDLFPRQENRELPPYPPALAELSDLDQETEDYLVDTDPECRLMADFVERTSDLIKCRQTTLARSGKRQNEKQPENEYYRSFRKYLWDGGFMDGMVAVMFDMFQLHPSLPADPVRYIRENYMVSEGEEAALLARWKGLREEVEALLLENKQLKEKLERARAENLLPSRSSPVPRSSIGRGQKKSLRTSDMAKADKRRSSATPQEMGMEDISWGPVLPSRKGAEVDRPQDNSDTSPLSDYSLSTTTNSK